MSFRRTLTWQTGLKIWSETSFSDGIWRRIYGMSRKWIKPNVVRRNWDSIGFTWKLSRWLNGACLFTNNASYVMRASCSGNISESLNHPYSMIPIDTLHLFLHICTSFSYLCRECCIFSYTPSTPQLSTQLSTTTIILISPPKKKL